MARGSDAGPVAIESATTRCTHESRSGRRDRPGAEGRRCLGLDVLARAPHHLTALPLVGRHDLGPALASTRAVYITYYPDLAVPSAPEAVGRLTELAVEAGVDRVVMLSGRGEPKAQRAGRVVADVLPDRTVLRCSWFAQNLDEGHLSADVLAGELALPVGDVSEPFVDLDDVADAAVAALPDDGRAGEVYELTGPRALAFAEAVGIISRAAGRPVRFRTIRGGRVPRPSERLGSARRGRGPAHVPGHDRPRRAWLAAGRRGAQGAEPRASGPHSVGRGRGAHRGRGQRRRAYLTAG